MSASYSGSPSTPKDMVRFKTGDTGQGTAFILSDEEISHFTDLYPGDINRAIVSCLDGIIGKLSYHPTFKLGEWEELRGDMIDKFRRMREDFLIKATSSGMSAGTSGPLTLNWPNEVEGDWVANRPED